MCSSQKTVLENVSAPEAQKHLLRCVVGKKNYSRHLDEQCVFHSRLQIEIYFRFSTMSSSVQYQSQSSVNIT